METEAPKAIIEAIETYLDGRLSPAQAIVMFDLLLDFPEILLMAHPSVREEAQALLQQGYIGGTRH